MKTNFLSFEKKQDPESTNGNGNGRKQRNYFDKFLELMMRKTGSDERTLIFGSDPFR
jgi:hypothetical protein